MTRKLTLLCFTLVGLLLAGCYKDFPFDLHGDKDQHPVQINFTQTNLFPEGVAYDPYRNWFYVSSLSRGDIGLVTFNGTYTPFITDESLVATTGLKVDEARKRLLVSNNANGIGAYELGSGDRIFFTDLSAELPGAPIFINDIALDPQGNTYATNSFSPVIYKVDRNGDASVFFQNSDFALAPGQFGFNGIAYDERGFLLASFSARNQVVKIPVRDSADYSIVQLDAALNRPDGLLLSKDGKQLVVVNNGGGPGKVVSFISNDAWQTGSLSTAYDTGTVFPSTATSDGKRVFVLYAYLHLLQSGWNNFTIQEVQLERPSTF
jgi:DNA-binding beta-propeller fold protein YncE